MTRAAANAAATADALLAWLETQPRVSTNATKGDGGLAASVLSDGQGGDASDACITDVQVTAPVARDSVGREHPVVRADAERRAAPMQLAHTDWLHHRLAVVGAADQLAGFRRAAAGAGIIPWPIDLDRMEEDVFHLLVSPPPPQPRTLSVAGARVLAGQLRDAVGRRHERAVARVGVSQACPFDLHTLLPVPDHVLRLGPDDPEALAWLSEHWGTTQSLRHVAEDADGGPDALPRPERTPEHDAIRLTFWSADWTPWRALGAVAGRWPGLRFDISPTYGES
jgi:hypothetical protein